MMFRLCFLVLMMVFSGSALARPKDTPSKRAGCRPEVARQYPDRCLPPVKPVGPRPTVRHMVVGTKAAPPYAARHVSPSHRAAQQAVLSPAPPVRDMSGYNTGLFVAPGGTPYPLTEPKPGDYICTTKVVPLDTKVMGMHSPKPYAPCGYKWAYDNGAGKGYWWLRPDANYGVRR